MRILIVSQYFWPENFKINDISIALMEKGYQVSVLTGKPNYPSGKFSDNYSFFRKNFESWNGIKIYRSPLFPRSNGKGLSLFLNYFSFAIFASLRVLFIKQKFDRVFVYEPSPITVGIPGIVAKFKFKAPMYFWVQDLWPESISAAGGVKNKFVINSLNLLTKWIYKHSRKILIQSKAFVPYILKQNVEFEKLIYYPNSTESFYKVLEPDNILLNQLPKGIKLMFAGNIGESQSFETLLSAAVILKAQKIDIQWLILGDGRMKEHVKQQIHNLGIQDCFHLFGSFDSIEMPKYFSCADALIVSLKNDYIFKQTIPSKVQSYMACGKPIIASLDGEGARIIEEANAGFVSPAENADALANTIICFLNLTCQEQIALGRNARLYFEQEFERELLVNKLIDVLK